MHGPWLRARWKDGEVSDKVLIYRRSLWNGGPSDRPLRLTFRRGAKPVVQEGTEEEGEQSRAERTFPSPYYARGPEPRKKAA